MDGLSGDAVARYLDQVATHQLGVPGDEKQRICPYLRPIGVVGTLVAPQVGLSGPITELNARIAAARLRPQVLPEECFIRQRTPYRDCAGNIIAYAATSRAVPYEQLREEVDHLGDAIGSMMAPAGMVWVRT